MEKKYNKVSDLIKDISESEKVKEGTIKEIESTSLSKFLFFLRCEHKLTQGELAEKIGCSQSRVSKIESSYDADLTVKDFLDYGKALNLRLEVGYRQKNVKITDLIKFHVVKAREYLTQLTDMVDGDEAISKGVIGFIKDFLYNMFDAVAANLQKLQVNKNVHESKDLIHISHPLQDKRIMEYEKLQKV